MKKLYSTILLLAMMAAVLSLTACGGDDENESGSKGKETLTIDGMTYKCSKTSSVEQTKGSGMYLTVITSSNGSEWNGKKLVVHISPSKVSQLNVGDVFEYDEISVRNYNNVSTIELNSYSWDAINGNIVIKDIREKDLTIQINKLTVRHVNTEVEHTIDGTATLYNSLYDSKGNMLPFSEI